MVGITFIDYAPPLLDPSYILTFKVSKGCDTKLDITPAAIPDKMSI
jgi:hypothetical protein